MRKLRNSLVVLLHKAASSLTEKLNENNVEFDFISILQYFN